MKTRIITGLLLAAAAIALLSLAPPWATYALLQVASLIVADEFYRITLGPGRVRERLAGMAAVGILTAVAWLWPAQLLPAMMCLMPVLLSLVLFTDASVQDMGPRAGFLLAGFVYLGLPMAALTLMAQWNQGTLVILALFGAVFAGDSGAFFSGKYLGNKKLYPKISPKKTWAGAYGGAVASALGFTIVVLAADLPIDVLPALLIGLMCGVAGQIGDLAESLFKRCFGVKDSGTLLPGHGGLLDRVDGVLFAAPLLWAVFTVAVR